MLGQWKGNYTGETDGEIRMNIRKGTTGLEVRSFLSPSDPVLPKSLASMRLGSEEIVQNAEASLWPINPETGRKTDWESIQHLFPEGVDHSKTANVNIQFKEGKIRISGESDLGFRFESVLEKVSDLPDPDIESVC